MACLSDRIYLLRCCLPGNQPNRAFIEAEQVFDITKGNQQASNVTSSAKNSLVDDTQRAACNRNMKQSNGRPIIESAGDSADTVDKRAEQNQRTIDSDTGSMKDSTIEGEGSDNDSDESDEDVHCVNCRCCLKNKLERRSLEDFVHMKHLQQHFRNGTGGMEILALPTRLTALSRKMQELQDCTSWRQWAAFMCSAYITMFNELSELHQLSTKWNQQVKLARKKRSTAGPPDVFRDTFGAKAELLLGFTKVLLPSTTLIATLSTPAKVDLFELQIIEREASDLLNICSWEAKDVLQCVFRNKVFMQLSMPWKDVNLVLWYLCRISGEAPLVHIKGTACWCQNCSGRFSTPSVPRGAMMASIEDGSLSNDKNLFCCNAQFLSNEALLTHFLQCHKNQLTGSEPWMAFVDDMYLRPWMSPDVQGSHAAQEDLIRDDGLERKQNKTEAQAASPAETRSDTPRQSNDNKASILLSTANLKNVQFNWPAADNCEKPSQWPSDRTISLKKHKCKTRGKPRNSDRPHTDPKDHVSVQARRRWIFKDPVHYDTARILLPLPGEKDRKGTLTWNAFCGMMYAEPLLFQVTEQHDVSYTFKRVLHSDPTSAPVVLTLHKPHTKQLLERHIVRNIGNKLKKSLKCEAEDFEFEDGRSTKA